jgi:hypothetical protein
LAPLRPTYKQESAAIVPNLLEPIQEVVESDESVVIASFLLIAKDTLRAKGDMGIGPYMLRRAIAAQPFWRWWNKSLGNSLDHCLG